MLINLSNHPSSGWGQNQLAEARVFGELTDMPFPVIDANGDELYIGVLSDDYLQGILQLGERERITVHIMGEMTFTFAMVERLKRVGIKCIASTTDRIVTELEDGRKEVMFRFVRFREYK